VRVAIPRFRRPQRRKATRLQRFLADVSRRSSVLSAAVYARELARLRLRRRRAFDAKDLLAFPEWLKSQAASRTALSDGRPWVTFSAITFLEEITRPDMRVFEFGSGGSSVFFARRALWLISIEHDATWHRRVQETLAAAGLRNVQAELHESEPGGSGDPADPDAYVSGEPQYAGRSFEAYASSIDPQPDGSFDLVLIDGRSRPACSRHALPKVASGGWLVLDNAERESYAYIHRTLDGAGWRKRTFEGPGPYVLGFWTTCAWQKPR
jgi:predicted O-methyltransferase YrrM